MIPFTTADEVYEQVVRSLPANERLKLVEKIAHDLSHLSPSPTDGEGREVADWLGASRSSLQEVWENDADSAYDRL